ncbi:MAG: MFS transporter [Clostridia bacterium]|nr:MFS transporter [Clostridia bacterium]
MKFRMTKLEKQWVLYDVGNSAFILIVATIVPIFFNGLAEAAGISAVDYLAYWGYASSVVTLVVALLGPVLGSMADGRLGKKLLLAASMGVGCLGCAALGFASGWMAFLVIFCIAKIGYSTSLIFYDAMLTDVSDEDRMDRVSASGYAWGYIGSCAPFLACLALILGQEAIGLSMTAAMRIAFLIIAAWWVAMTVPLLRSYRQKHRAQGDGVADSFRRLGATFREIGRNKGVLVFLLAFFCYIDGVYTIIDMATAFGQALGLDTNGLLVALLVTQIVAFPCSLTFGRLAKRYPAERLITVCIAGYLLIALYAMRMSTQTDFWILAVAVGMFQGGIQAMTRSYYARIIPAERSGEYFGIMDICGKGASFVGTTLVGVMSQLTGSVNAGVASLAILFVAGLVLFRVAARMNQGR